MVIRICNIISDFILLVVTGWRTWGTVVTAKRARVQASFASLLLRDGVLITHRTELPSDVTKFGNQEFSTSREYCHGL